MKFRNTLILLALVVVLGGYVLFVERKQPAPAEPGTTPIPTALAEIVAFDPAQVKAVRYSRPAQNQRTELVADESGAWRLTAPVEDEANQSVVERMIDTLAHLRPSRALTGTVESPADYGLDPAVMTIDVELKDGTTRTITLGDQNASQSGYYGQISGNETIYLLPFSVGSDAERTLNSPPIKPTPVPTPAATEPPLIPPPPTPTATK